MGKGIGSVESAIEDMLYKAKEEIQVAAFQITEGSHPFLQIIESSLSRGIRVTLIINKFESQPLSIQKELQRLADLFPHFTQVDFDPKDGKQDLHAKIIVVDRSVALVGSPNLTWRGLVLNHELGVVLSGPVAGTISRLLDALATDSFASVRSAAVE
jgi:cardiolipin synthase